MSLACYKYYPPAYAVTFCVSLCVGVSACRRVGVSAVPMTFCGSACCLVSDVMMHMKKLLSSTMTT